MRVISILIFLAGLALSACTNAGTTEVSKNTPAYEARSIAVLSDVPMALELCDKACNTVASFDPTWQQTGRGYETTITVSTEVFHVNRTLQLIRADGKGWSDWGSAEINYLKRNDVTAADPACVGGTAWCSTRGL